MWGQCHCSNCVNGIHACWNRHCHGHWCQRQWILQLPVPLWCCESLTSRPRQGYGRWHGWKHPNDERAISEHAGYGSVAPKQSQQLHVKSEYGRHTIWKEVTESVLAFGLRCIFSHSEAVVFFQPFHFISTHVPMPPPVLHVSLWLIRFLLTSPTFFGNPLIFSLNASVYWNSESGTPTCEQITSCNCFASKIISTPLIGCLPAELPPCSKRKLSKPEMDRLGLSLQGYVRGEPCRPGDGSLSLPRSWPEARTNCCLNG